MASGSAWKLRRLADRVLRVQARRAGESGAVAAFGATLLPKTNAFIAAYDTARSAEAGWRKEMSEGKGASAALVKVLRSWLPTFERDVPGFDGTDFADRANVPDDVIADAGRLLEVSMSAGAAWAATFQAELQPKLAAAVSEWAEAEASDASYQQAQRAAREAGALFDAELQLYRVTLAAVFGSNDKDFQRLRADRAAKDDDEAPPDGAAGPTPTPA